ncbi:hypothetical protein ACFQ0X_43915 [Streptomyces rectiviolaceus]
MLRAYLPAIISTLLYTAIGISFGLLWWAWTGRTDMPWWIAVLLVAVAGLISDLVEETLQQLRARRASPGPSRHRKAGAR